MHKSLIRLACTAILPTLAPFSVTIAAVPAASAPAGCSLQGNMNSAPCDSSRAVRPSGTRPVTAASGGTASSGTQTVPEAENLTIVLGEIRLLPVAGKVTRVALGSAAVVSATTVDRNLLLIAEKLGETSLMVWAGGKLQHYKVRVIAKDLKAIRDKVDILIAGQKGITIQQVGEELILSGYAHKEVIGKLNTMLGELPNVVNNIREDQGSAFNRSVLFRLHFVEVKRSLLEQIGIAWQKDAAGPTIGMTGVARNTGIYNPIPGIKDGDNLLDPEPKFVSRGNKTGGVFFGLATTIASRINLGINNGDARVLASPELTARSGGKAKLQVGGEVPIPVAGAFGSTSVEFKPYGILFSIEPQIDADDVISAKVSTEMSQIDPSVSVAGIPGFITRNTATEVSVKPGDMVALSGLVNSELANSIDRVPGLSKIPIFGRLFRSDDFRHQKSELVVFVESEIITAGQGMATALRDRGVAAEQEFLDKAQRAGQPPQVLPDRTTTPTPSQWPHAGD